MAGAIITPINVKLLDKISQCTVRLAVITQRRATLGYRVTQHRLNGWHKTLRALAFHTCSAAPWRNACTIKRLAYIYITKASDFALIADVTPAGCSDSEDGVIALATENGVGEVEFTFVGPFGAMSVGDTIEGVGAGVYEVTALDEAGCPSVLLVQVDAPPPVIVVLDSLDRPSCTSDADGCLCLVNV